MTRDRRDTRRYDEAGRLIGEHYGTSWYGPGGRWYKTRLHRAERKTAKLRARGHRVRDWVVGKWASEVNWRGS